MPLVSEVSRHVSAQGMLGAAEAGEEELAAVTSTRAPPREDLGSRSISSSATQYTVTKGFELIGYSPRSWVLRSGSSHWPGDSRNGPALQNRGHLAWRPGRMSRI